MLGSRAAVLPGFGKPVARVFRSSAVDFTVRFSGTFGRSAPCDVPSKAFARRATRLP